MTINAQNTKHKYLYPRDMKLKCISIMKYVMMIVHRRPNYIQFILKRHEVVKCISIMKYVTMIMHGIPETS